MVSTSNRILDDIARLATDAAGAAQGVRREVETVVKTQIERAEAAILKSGRILGSTAPSGKAAKAMAGRGFRFIVGGSDVGLLGQGVRAMLGEAKG